MISKGIPDKPGIAYAIGRSIQRNGIKAKPYLREIKLKLKDYNDDIKAALDKDIAVSLEEIKENFKQLKQ